MKDNCSNCLFSRVRRFEAWCELDKEIKYMHHVCNKYKRGTQAEMIRKDGTVTWHLLPLWELDKEIKYMHHVCNKYKRGTQAEMIRKDGTVTWHLLPLWE